MNQLEEELVDFFGNEQRYVKFLIESTPKTDVCSHKVFFEEDGIRLCYDCGQQIQYLDFEAEWRFYGASDNRPSRDPSRCHRSKESTRGGIDKVFVDAKLDIPQAIKKKTECKYKRIVGNETVRGRGRRSIVAACLLYVYREEGDFRTADEVRKMFNHLSKQEMSDGLSRYHMTFPEDRTKHARPVDLVRRIMHLTSVDIRHYPTIVTIAKHLENADMTLNHSSPQSVASAVVYLYLCLRPDYKEKLGLTKTKFAQKVGLSEITISKLVKRAADVANCHFEEKVKIE
jgi:transcription initiation factor TFIIIB Brf1 subunit/transcription initiation factor TFIIB